MNTAFISMKIAFSGMKTVVMKFVFVGMKTVSSA